MLDYEPIVKRWFSSHGYQITKIPETNEKSPDFLIHDDTSTYVLELKTKFPSEEEIDEREKILSMGEIHDIEELITTKNELSKIISKAKTQLRNYKKGEDILRLVWLSSTGHLAELRLEQFETTLYGSAYLLLTEERYGCCYFFDNSDFFKYREVLDAAIVSKESNGKKLVRLLINPLSPRYSQMKNSSLLKCFKEGSIVDPITLADKGLAFLVDSDVDRNDKEAVLQYLKGKYKSDKIIVSTLMYVSETIDL